VNNFSPGKHRVVSGMRTTGMLHLGHYYGVLKNWLSLQHQYECYFFAADIHALTTHYENPAQIHQYVLENVIDWLSVGINPGSAHIFVQSWIHEHSELQLLLAMMTPLSWLERIPTYKDQQEKLRDKDLTSYGFLGYPLLQAADILLYKGNYVPVGEDQLAHVEVCREIARRFNHLYGREPDFAEVCETAISKMGKKNAKLYRDLRRAYQERGDHEALAKAHALLAAQHNISIGDQERLFGYLDGVARIILPEPEALLTQASCLPGLDGQKMSKSYANTIRLRESTESLTKKIRKMPTDPARVKRNDPGTPEKCPVWDLHRVFSKPATCAWVREGCTSAGIGCLDCKQPLIEAIDREIAPIRSAAEEYQDNLPEVKSILAEGTEKAREVARVTLTEVKQAMHLEN
jgi:tryptophanyl-tRNA synthetase